MAKKRREAKTEREIELKHFRAFLAVVDNGTLGEAAKQLEISQPNLTHIVQGLERALGGRVFNRSSRGMMPNALGKALEARARVIAGEVGRARREIGELLDSSRGRVVMGGGSVCTHPVILAAIGKFRQAHPKIEIELRDVLIRAGLLAVKAGEVDYVISNFGESDDPEVTREMLLPAQRVSIVASPDNPVARAHRVSLKEIWAGPWLLPDPGTIFRRRVDEIVAAAGLPPLRPVIETNSIYLTKAYLARGDVIGPFQEFFIHDELRQGKIRRVAVSGFDWNVEIGVVYRTGVPLPPASAKLLDFIRRECVAHRRKSRT